MISAFSMPADVSHRNHDREAGELCSHEGGLRQLPAAPASPPFQLPVPTPNALGSHPQEGQGEIHVQVRLGVPLGVTGKLGECIGPLSTPCHLLHMSNMGRVSKTIRCAVSSEPSVQFSLTWLSSEARGAWPFSIRQSTRKDGEPRAAVSAVGHGVGKTCSQGCLQPSCYDPQTEEMTPVPLLCALLRCLN